MLNINIIAIIGPSASGKTLLTKKMATKLGFNNASILSQDQYYKDWSKLSFKKRKKINFDHPNSFDFYLMKRDLSRLKNGLSIDAPSYSYKLHKRIRQKIKIEPKTWIIVEGLLVLHKKSLRDLFDIKIYVDADKQTILARRIKRDLKQRGETIETVCNRYFKYVLPMQEKYIQPQKKWVDITVDGRNTNNPRLFDKLIKVVKGR